MDRDVEDLVRIFCLLQRFEVAVEVGGNEVCGEGHLRIDVLPEGWR